MSENQLENNETKNTSANPTATKFPLLSAALLNQDEKILRDTAFGKYKNVICVVCNEWICARNRKNHIESHLNYRPFHCSHCDFSSRRDIFMRQHIKSKHYGLEGIVVCLNIPDVAIENEVERLAQDCLTSTQKSALQILESGTRNRSITQAVISNRPILVIESVRKIRPIVKNRTRQKRTKQLNLDKIFKISQIPSNSTSSTS
ncbi:unnamed protein product [Caenorhabditis angaria]|uniref:C2H2-type domain-containing protein n=1 Tax=Caenorhabditis angaria TaxID=860376 RepID=A0A9P1N232_9PELO|nr:unnamed protein product [Caenorhabditis angaria]